MALATEGLTVTPVKGIPAIKPGDDLPRILARAVSDVVPGITSNDVLVVAQKVVSKAEGAIARLSEVTPGQEAIRIAAEVNKDPRLVQVILSCSVRIVRKVPGVLITETRHGLICANAGVDASNSLDYDTVVLLPENPDTSAELIRQRITQSTGESPAVIISDTFNRPWRQGSVNVGIGTVGFDPLDDARGMADDRGHTLQATLVSIADEVASAAQLVMGETGGVPAAIVRGLKLRQSEEGSASLLREPERDLFR